MHLPEAPQDRVRRARQGHEAIPVAFGVADLYSLPHAIDVARLEAQSFAQEQSQAVEGEAQHAVTDHAGGEQPLGLFDRDDVQQTLTLRRLDQARRHPGLLQDVLVARLQPIQIERERTPRVRLGPVREILG